LRRAGAAQPQGGARNQVALQIGHLARYAAIGGEQCRVQEQRHRESVLGGAAIVPFGNFLLRFTDGGFGRRGGKGRQHRE